MSDCNKILISLINSAVYDKKIRIEEINDVNYRDLFVCAQKHKVTNLVYFGLKNNAEELNVKDEVMAVFEKAYKINLIHSSNQDFVLNEIGILFNENNIKYIPLKGSVIKNVYPHSYFRTMSDIDILYKQNEDVDIDKILKSNGFIKKEEKDKDKIYTKYSVLIEVHKTLTSSENVYYNYFSGIWDRAILKDRCEYEMSREDFLIFHIVHMANHCMHGGIGIRFFLDVQMYLNAYSEEFNWSYYNDELRKLRLNKFSQKVIHLSNVWFGEENENDDDALFMQFVFAGGAYGTEYSSVATRKALINDKNGDQSNTTFIINSIFPPYRELKEKYGWIKSPILIPIGWIKLNFERLKRWRITRHNMKIMRSNQDELVNDTRNLFDELGLL